jgi:hypothetical protein
LVPSLCATKRCDDGRQITAQGTIQSDGRPELLRCLADFARLSTPDKARHLFQSATARFDDYLNRFVVSPATSLGCEIVSRICFALGMRLPIGMREFYINSVYERAASGYMAESYNGLVVLFKPFQDPAVDLTSWQTLVGNGLEIHHVPGHHVDVLSNRDHVKIWAEVLARHLQRLYRIQSGSLRPLL